MTEAERNQARTAKARIVLIRRTDEKIAARLRDHGWTCTPPEDDTAIQDGRA